MPSPQSLRVRAPFHFVCRALQWGLFAAALHGQTASDVSAFGPLSMDPVVISGSWSLNCSGPASFDFGPREVVFASGTLDVLSTGVIRARAGTDV